MNSFRPHVKAPSVIGFFIPVVTGILIAQALATVFVYHSNLGLQAAVAAIGKSGYFPVPNGTVASTLDRTGPAIWGGLFFTLSIGTGLTLATWAGVLVWDRALKRDKKVLAVMLLGWAGLILAVNLNGAVLYPSLFCALVPLATAGASVAIRRAGRQEKSRLEMMPVIALVLLTALWATQLNQQLFVSIRDHVLLSNAMGRTVNDFYYKYTLYAAQAFKSFGQKTLRTARIEGIDNAVRLNRMERQLARNDVIPVAGIAAPDITMIFSGNNLRFEHRGKTIIHTTADQFLELPKDVLQSFSRATDRFGPFRKLTLIGLLAGFPVLLFMVVYGITLAGLTLLMGRKRAIAGASGLCMAIGILLFLPMLKARPLPSAVENLGEQLSAPQWPQRVAALRYIDSRKIDIARYPQYLKLLQSPLVVERYWLARALGGSRSSAAYEQLLKLMKDPHPNVVCQAYYALGQSGRRAAVAPIQEQMAHSSHWYAQWYGYRALRKLGWHQDRST